MSIAAHLDTVHPGDVGSWVRPMSDAETRWRVAACLEEVTGGPNELHRAIMDWRMDYRGPEMDVGLYPTSRTGPIGYGEALAYACIAAGVAWEELGKVGGPMGDTMRTGASLRGCDVPVLWALLGFTPKLPPYWVAVRSEPGVYAVNVDQPLRPSPGGERLSGKH